jgi:hypothetical protein
VLLGQRLGSPDHRPTTTWVQKTISCKKYGLSLLKMGKKIAPKHAELVEYQ